jgi:hypothetical protein
MAQSAAGESAGAECSSSCGARRPDAGLMTDEASIEAGEGAYAWIWPDGVIYRRGRAIGSAAELEYLEDWHA